MRAIGFHSELAHGSEIRFSHDTASSRIPLDRLVSGAFSFHGPHGSWGYKFAPTLLDALKQRLGHVGVTYELIREFYEGKGVVL